MPSISPPIEEEVRSPGALAILVASQVTARGDGNAVVKFVGLPTGYCTGMHRLPTYPQARKLRPRSTRLGVGLIALTMVGAFIGFALAVVQESALLGVVVYFGTVVLVVVLMLMIGSQGRRRGKP
jgi:hypothetical protein